MKGHSNVEADALSRLPHMEADEGIKIMLNHSPIAPQNPLLNKYPLNLNLVHKYQQLDDAY